MPKLPRIWQAAIAILALTGVTAAIASVREMQTRDQMLRADPDSMPPALLNLAASREAPSSAPIAPHATATTPRVTALLVCLT